MTSDPHDHFRVRHAWLILMFASGGLPALLLYPYFGWAHLWPCAGLGVLGAGLGLWDKYRSRFTPVNRLISLAWLLGLLMVIATGGVGVFLAIVLKKQEIVSLAGGIVCLAVAISALSGFWQAAAIVRATPEPDSIWLSSRVDLACGVMRDSRAQSTRLSWPQARYNFLIALGLNIPLIAEAAGHARYSMLILLVPFMVGLAGWAAFALGQDTAYLWSIARLERQAGHRFVTERLDELRALRRTFWFAKWLCKPEDLVEPQTPSTQRLTRKERRRAGVAGASAR